MHSPDLGWRLGGSPDQRWNIAARRLGGSAARRLGGSAARRDAGIAEGEREAWPDPLIDVVRFKRAFLEVYDGPGAEGGTVASSADVPADGHRLVGVTPVPCLRVLRSRFPAGEYVCAVRRGEKPPMPAPRPYV